MAKLCNQPTLRILATFLILTTHQTLHKLSSRTVGPNQNQRTPTKQSKGYQISQLATMMSFSLQKMALIRRALKKITVGTIGCV